MGFDYGWDNGKLAMEKTPLTPLEETTLTEITEKAFYEMGIRTCMGSGDDRYYVEKMIEHLNSDPNNKTLVRIVFRLTLQAVKPRLP